MFVLPLIMMISFPITSDGLLLPIFRELGMVWNPYDYEGGLLRRGDPDGLDPIEPSLPGCINVKKLLASAKHLRVDIVTNLAESLATDAGFHKHVKPDLKSLQRNGYGRATNVVFAGCLAMLLAWRLLEDVTDRHVQLLCFFTFFTVAKSNGKLRAIFDCRALGRVCADPPRIRLAPIPEAMQEAAKIGARYMVSCDLKHYFFQLSLPSEAQRLFGCRCDSRYYVSNVVAMGFSWSPAWSMMATLLLIMHIDVVAGHDTDRLGVRIKEIRKCPHVPGTINLYDKRGKKCGLIVIYYDNIGIFVRDRKLAYDWVSRLRSNAKHFGHRFKEMEVAYAQGVHDVIKFDDDGNPMPEICRPEAFISFLGVEVDMCCDGHVFRWRHSATKLEKWLKLFNDSPSTAREVARIIGILMWNSMIHLSPLAEISAEVDVLRDIASMMQNKADWDKELERPPQRLSKDVVERWRVTLAVNPWISVEHLTTARTVYLASDGTETSIAGVLLSDQGVIADSFGKQLPKSHVYIKEVLAAYMTILWAHSLLPRYEGWSEYRIAIDSTSAAAAVGRCYSSNPGVNKMLLHMWKFARENKIVIRPVDIFTDWNVADNPSRNRLPTQDLAEKTIEVLKGAASRPDAAPTSEKPSGYLPMINGIEVPDYLEIDQDQTWQKLLDHFREFDDEDVVADNQHRQHFKRGRE